MRHPSDRFKIAVKGAGALAAMFFTEVMRKFPKATVYDRTDRSIDLRHEEVRLGLSDQASPAFRASAFANLNNLTDPAATDVTVTFTVLGDLERVGVVELGRNRVLLFHPKRAASLKELEGFVRQIVRAVGETG